MAQQNIRNQHECIKMQVFLKVFQQIQRFLVLCFRMIFIAVDYVVVYYTGIDAVRNLIIFYSKMNELKVPSSNCSQFNSYKSTGELIPKCRSEALQQKRASIRSKINMLAKEIYQLKYDAQCDEYQLKELSNKGNLLFEQASQSIKNIECQKQILQQTAVYIIMEQKGQLHQPEDSLFEPNPLILQELSLSASNYRGKDQLNFQKSDRSTEIQFEMKNEQKAMRQYQYQSFSYKSSRNQIVSDFQNEQLYPQQQNEGPQYERPILKKESKKQNPRLSRRNSSYSAANFMFNSLLTIIILSVILILIT